MNLYFFLKIILVLYYTGSECLGTTVSHEELDEGPCMDDISNYAATKLDLLWFGTSRYFYVPLASARCYLGYAEALLGRQIKSVEELEEMKLRIYTQIFVPPIVTNYGFGEERFFRQYCIPNGLGLAESVCHPLPFTGSPGSNTTGIERSEDTVVYTDNKTTVMFVRCINRSFRDYKVLSTKPKLDSETEKIIQKKIKELGFNPKLIRFTDYDKAEIQPAQNYDDNVLEHSGINNEL